MNYLISKPSAILAPFVKHYWAMDDCIPEGKTHTQRIVPHGLLELTFYMGDKPETSAENKSISENTLITGHLKAYYDLEVSKHLSLFSILFQPYGLSSFLNIPINEMHNQNVPLKYILHDGIEELETSLFEANSFEERVVLAEQFLMKLLRKKSIPRNYDRIKDSIQRINQSKGQANIEHLASEACYSRKQFERTFSNMVGTSPKQFLKVIRFQNALHKKSKNEKISLTTLTYDCGYYDQSHMINDFYKLTGMSPKKYFAQCAPYSDYFQ